MTEIINIGNRREVFWDEYLIDAEKTTAVLKQHKPQPKETVIKHDEPWEGDGCNYHNILKDGDLYRMYYLGWEMLNPEVTAHVPGTRVVCYAESGDGINWVKPKLNIFEFEGSKENNIILDETVLKIDNFFVFKDENPDCRQEERYKGICSDGRDHYLWCYTSGDGIHFKKAWQMTNKGKFDTLNVALWDKYTKQYIAFIRNFHDIPEGADINLGIRDIRWMVSDDFVSWSDPVLLDFGSSQDMPLYTNVVQKYYRAEHMFIGFPSRYVERERWTENYDELTGAENRRKRMNVNKRYGLAVTDCVMMTSRNGKSWKRFDEAFMTPGPESGLNWVYGDCYPSVGMIETKNHLPRAGNEISMYAKENHWSMQAAELRRYTIRIDGFVSYNAPYKPCRVVTKPIIFKGSKLFINFATSAIGYLKIRLMTDDEVLESAELFGDSVNREVCFNKDLAKLSGKAVVMEIEMSDADIYSFIFAD